MSLKDIAAIAGVSVSTVSRVLNDPSSSCASRSVRRRIFDAARDTGYAPSAAARALKCGNGISGSAPRVSVILARISSLDSDPFFDELSGRVESELLKRGLSLGGTFFADDAAHGESAPSDGYVILGRCSDALLKSLRERTSNIVGVWRNPSDFTVDEVLCDGKTAAKEAVKHLISLGHRDIAYIGDCSSETRYVGYCETLIQSRIPINYPLITEASQDMDGGRAAMTALLKSGGATAVLCANDITALGALDAIKHVRGGKKPPVSVISIDDIAAAAGAGLTTIHIPQRDMAHMAACMLSDRISGGHSECVRVEFPCRLIERDTCFVRAL